MTYDEIVARLQVRLLLLRQIAPRGPAQQHQKALLREVKQARFCGPRCLGGCDPAWHAAEAARRERMHMPAPPPIFLAGDEVDLISWRCSSGRGIPPGRVHVIERTTPAGWSLVEGRWYSADGRGRGAGANAWRLRLQRRGLTPLAMVLQAIDLAAPAGPG